MNDNIRKIRLTQPIWKIQEVLDICNEQSKKGFQLEKMYVLRKSIFKKDEDKRYIYAADCNFSILKKGEERENYIANFTETGWEFVDNTFNGFSVFRKEYKEELIEKDYEIYTDKETLNVFYSRIEHILKTIMRIFIPLEIILLCLSVIMWYWEFGELSVCFALLILFCIAITVALTIFLVSGIKAIQKEKNK